MKCSWTLLLSFSLVLIEGPFKYSMIKGDEDSRQLVKRQAPPSKSFKIICILYTKDNGNYTSECNEEFVTKLESGRPTIFITHGFMANPYIAPWIQELIPILQKNDIYNIVVVEWMGGNGPNYLKAKENCRIVGRKMAFIIGHMEKSKDIKSEDCTIIGHSLGAHIAGFAGQELKKMNKNLGKIVGLDPAGPLYEGTPPSARLDPSDAMCVIAIHSDAGFLGITQPVGHKDFYPNCGHDQPGCSVRNKFDYFAQTKDLGQAVKNGLLCSHVRAAILYVLCLANQKEGRFIAIRCPSCADFNDGKCTDCGPNGANCVSLCSEFLECKANANNKFYLITGASRPYNEYLYQVKINFKDANYQRRGKIQLTLQQSNKKELTNNINETPKPLTSSKPFVGLLTLPYKLDSSTKVSFTWSSTNLNLPNTPTLGIERVEINLIHERTQDSSVLSYQPINNPVKEKTKAEMRLLTQ